MTFPIVREILKIWRKPFTIALLLFLAVCQVQAAAFAQVKPNTDFVDVRSLNPNIVLDIRYATTNNFTRRKLYRQARCVLRTPVAQQLSRVQTELQTQGLGLKVYDCYRPLSVQKLMWQIVPDERYVANPAKGSRHNRGAAVDLTLVDRSGKELEMPTEFDDFTERAHRDFKDVSPQARANRQKLETVMQKYGFVPLPTEWWHFDSKDWQQYPIRDISIDAIR